MNIQTVNMWTEYIDLELLFFFFSLDKGGGLVKWDEVLLMQIFQMVKNYLLFVLLLK